MASYTPAGPVRYPSEPERALRAVVLGIVIGVALVGLGRPRPAPDRRSRGAGR